MKLLTLTVIFWRKPFSEKWLAVRVFFLLAFFRFLILLFPFKKLAAYLGNQGVESPKTELSEQNAYIESVCRKVSNISRMVPWEAKCLVQAAAGKSLMKTRNIASTIYFGVKKNDSGNLEAHAWLRVGTDIVLGGEIADEYTIVERYA